MCILCFHQYTNHALTKAFNALLNRVYPLYEGDTWNIAANNAWELSERLKTNGKEKGWDNPMRVAGERMAMLFLDDQGCKTYGYTRPQGDNELPSELKAEIANLKSVVHLKDATIMGKDHHIWNCEQMLRAHGLTPPLPPSLPTAMTGGTIRDDRSRSPRREPQPATPASRQPTSPRQPASPGESKLHVHRVSEISWDGSPPGSVGLSVGSPVAGSGGFVGAGGGAGFFPPGSGGGFPSGPPPGFPLPGASVAASPGLCRFGWPGAGLSWSGGGGPGGVPSGAGAAFSAGASGGAGPPFVPGSSGFGGWGASGAPVGVAGAGSGGWASSGGGVVPGSLLSGLSAWSSGGAPPWREGGGSAGAFGAGLPGGSGGSPASSDVLRAAGSSSEPVLLTDDRAAPAQPLEAYASLMSFAEWVYMLAPNDIIHKPPSMKDYFRSISPEKAHRFLVQSVNLAWTKAGVKTAVDFVEKELRRYPRFKAVLTKTIEVLKTYILNDDLDTLHRTEISERKMILYAALREYDVVFQKPSECSIPTTEYNDRLCTYLALCKIWDLHLPP